ncbi:MAG: hypothetical protein QOH89_838 [Pseudonocardiales bacterium]|nr:hypothetical protein [Pseudonocardiales bacterium]
MPSLTLRKVLGTAAAALLSSVVVPLAAASDVGAAPSSDDVTITQDDNTNGCNGVRTTPGSENTTKVLVGGTLVPGGTAIFEISFPFDPTKLTGQDTFKMTDCVFIAGDAFAKYFITGVPNGTSPFIFQITLDIPEDADLGANYCNYVKTTENPTAPQESNRKAGPACFRIGGDIRVVKVAEGDGSLTPLAGATFDVSCVTPTGGETVPPVVITGLSGQTSFSNGAYVASGVSATGEIAIAGPIDTECTVTETVPPPGYDLPADPTQVLTIGRNQVTGTFVDPLSRNDTSIVTSATSGTVGDAVTDTATLSGATVDASGTITFSVYDNSECGGDPVFTDTVDVDGNGDYTSAPFTPDAPGHYFWIATYSGDDQNKPSTGSCRDEGETSVLTAPPTHATSASSSHSTTNSSVPSTPEPSHSVASTGAGPVNDELGWALALIVLGGAAAAAGRQTYRRLH